MEKTKQTQKGFTLIEVLVAIAIFMIFITSISSAYLDIARSQREANVVRAMYSEVRYIFDLIGQEARAKTIDYGCTGSLDLAGDIQGDGFARTPQETSSGCLALKGVSSENYLALVNHEGTERTIFLLEDDTQDETKKLFYLREEKEAFERGWIAAPGFDGFTEITLKSIQLDNFMFEIAPLADPFDIDNIGCGPVQFQPSVSLYASVSGRGEQAKNFSMDLQTTVSSRVYNHQTNL
ncbi:prepilin-type N-terminal cleavage/methylation domain-containing protein [Candidatus Peregrinibacteria bacterium]|nr:prepilin-type N-terminal cleavage/methylation domain-containing protein [Candidatus Peregrinibacteria bacterium]